VASIGYLQDINRRWIILETYFHNDSRIRTWINQIIENIFTVCILTGVDSEEEFQKGCQIVMKLTVLLENISTLSSELLEDGVKQLVEQQLPDARVINNFPTFRDIMDRMIQEGILKANENQKKEVNIECVADSALPDDAALQLSYIDMQHSKEETQANAEAQALAEALAQAEEQAKADAQALAEALAQAEEQAKADAQALEEAQAQIETRRAEGEALAEALAQAEEQANFDAQALEDAQAQVEIQRAEVEKLAEALAQAREQAKADAQALAQAEIQAKADAQAIADALAQVDTKLETLIKIERHELVNPKFSTSDDSISQTPMANNAAKFESVVRNKVPALLTAINSKITQVFSTTIVPQQADLLKKVINTIFPNSSVYWNKHLMGHTFLAQVEDILICLHNPEHPCNLKKYNKDGWKVLVCSSEDLAFPRRLEREIRQIQRSRKMSETL